MKMFKRLNKQKVSAVLAAVMFLGSFPAMNVLAESPTIKVTSDTVSIEPGGEITFTFTPDTTYTAGFGTTIDWDASSINEYIDSISKTAATGWIFNDVHNASEYVIRAGSVGGSLTADAQIGTITIDTKDNIPAGTYTLPVKSSYMSDATNGFNEAADPLEAEAITFTVTDDGNTKPATPTETPAATPDAGGGSGTGTGGGGSTADPTEAPATEPTTVPTAKPADEHISNKGILIDGRGLYAGNKFYLVVQDGSKNYIDNTGAMCTTDGDIKVVLPATVTPSESNRITAHVYDATGEVIIPNDSMSPIKGISVTFQVTGSSSELVDVTDAYGRAVVPPIATDITDKNGNSSVKKDDKAYDVHVGKDGDPIEDAKIEIGDDGGVTVTLPEDRDLDYDDRIPVVVTDPETGDPVKDVTVTVKDENGNEVSSKTDANGQVLAPPENMDKTDADGKATVKDPTKEPTAADYEKNVVVKDEDGPIKDAIVAIDPETGEMTITLPDGKVIDPTNRITIEITDGEGNPVPDLDVDIKDSVGNVISETTGDKGKVVSPDPSRDVTDNNGKGSLTFTDKDGNEVTYETEVTDSDGPIKGATLEIKDGVVNVVLPDDKVLTTDKPITVKLTDEDNKPVSGVNVTIKDKTTSATGTTKTTGDVTLPVQIVRRSSGGGGGGGGSSSSTINYTVTVKDNNGKSVTTTKTVDKKTGDLTLTLPKGTSLKNFDGYYTIIVKDNKGTLKSNINVTLQDKDGISLKGKTDKNGKLVIPTEEHEAYLFGYPDGEFKPEGYITRAETASIFTRLLTMHKDEKKGKKTPSFSDAKSSWASTDIAYLENYDIVTGFDKQFNPDKHITRAEFVSMAVRYYKLNTNRSPKISGVSKFADMKNKDYWAYDDIMLASDMGWISGYNSSTTSTAEAWFRPDDFVTRAEAVAIINKIEGRAPHKEFINLNMPTINPYSDMKSSKAWYMYDIMEASYDHDFVMTKAVSGDKTEEWVN